MLERWDIIFKMAVSDKQSPERGFAIWKGESVQDVGSGEAAPLVSQVYDRMKFNFLKNT